LAQFGLSALAQQEQLLFQIAAGIARSKKTLPDGRRSFRGTRAWHRGVHRHFTPPQTVETHFGGQSCQDAPYTILFPRQQKEHAQAEIVWQVNATHAAHELVWDRSEQTRSVPAGAVCIHTAAMRQSFERGKRPLHHFVRALAAQADDEADAAGVMVRMTLGRAYAHDTVVINRPREKGK